MKEWKEFLLSVIASMIAATIIEVAKYLLGL